METQKKIIFVNVYQDRNGEMSIGSSYSTFDEAMHSQIDSDYLKTIEITNEI